MEQFPEIYVEIYIIKQQLVKILEKDQFNIEQDILPNFGINPKYANKLLDKALEVINNELENRMSGHEVKKNMINKIFKIVDYQRRKVINASAKSFWALWIGQYKKYNDKSLYKLNIKPQIKGNFLDYIRFVNKRISNFFEDFKPKGSKKKLGDYIIKQINEAIKKEREEKKDVLYKIYHFAYILDFLYAFLEDKDYIIIENKINNTFEVLRIEGFKTFKDCFNAVNKEEKEAMKKDMKEILLGEKKKARNKKS